MVKGEIMFLPPGVSEAFAERSGWGFGYVTWDEVRALVKPRAEDVHKGMYGHALLVCGSRGMPGAAVLSAGAALRSGCGLVTVHLPESERFPVEANFPSAMVSLDTADCFTELPADMTRYTAVGIGCGLGQDSRTVEALECLLEWCRTRKVRMVIDADALNMLSGHTGLQRLVPAGTILTPHLGELRRVVGTWRDEEEMLERANGLAARLDSVVVVKGPNSAVFNRGKCVVFNSTGNGGMAKGGSGDVLTGFLTGLLARGYEPDVAAVLGVFLHGVAGDKAAEYYGMEGMNSADLIDFLAEALKETE